jgi:hypothetical protein
LCGNAAVATQATAFVFIIVTTHRRAAEIAEEFLLVTEKPLGSLRKQKKLCVRAVFARLGVSAVRFEFG